VYDDTCFKGASVAVYHLTFHAYLSWLPDRPRGYVRDGEILPPDEQMAAWYRRDARGEAVTFCDHMQATIVRAVRQTCDTFGWRLHQARAIPTHVHTIVSWREFVSYREVGKKLKQQMGRSLSLLLDRPGPWFVRGFSHKRVTRREHFDYLMLEYLPKHGGAFWREDVAEG
jgi:REP element-mobilizing transposase RayT